MPRVVLDTVVFVRALINPHNRAGQLIFEHADRYTIVFSTQTAQELLEVIRRPELTRKYKRLSGLDFEKIIDILSSAEAVEIDSIPSVVRDPNDDIFVATAIAGRADYIVSEDKDLLSLGNSIGVQVIDTESFLALILK